MKGVDKFCAQRLDRAFANGVNLREFESGLEALPDFAPGGDADIDGFAHLRVGFAIADGPAKVPLVEPVLAHEIDHEALALTKCTVGQLAHHQVDASVYAEIAPGRRLLV